LKAVNKWKAILHSTAPSICSPALQIAASYVHVEDLQITSSTPFPASCNFGSWANAVGAESSSAVAPVVKGIYVPPGTTFCLAVKLNLDESVIEGNTVYGDLEMLGNSGGIIRNNRVYTGGAATHNVGIFIKGGTKNAQIYDNVVTMASSGADIGIQLGGSTGIQWMKPPYYEAYNCVAYDNVVINNSPGSFSLAMSGAIDSAFFNNVVIGNAKARAIETLTSVNNAATTNPTFVNNIFSCGGGTTLGSWSYKGPATLHNNDFFDCTGAPSQSSGGLKADPMFVNPSSDWHLRPGSPALGAGANVTFKGYSGEIIDVSHEMNGAVRSVPWNMGVY
jgi:hypothetical protein